MKKELEDIIIRYTILVGIAAFGIPVIYKIFTPLTLYPVFFLLKIIGQTTLHAPAIIIFQGLKIEIIPACVAGAAYFLLLVLNIATPLEYKKRIKGLLFLLGGFLIINILRIVFLSILALQQSQLFEIVHKTSWYFGSTLMLLLLWSAHVYLLKIKEVPLYTDVQTILKAVSKKKSSTKNKKRRRKTSS